MKLTRRGLFAALAGLPAAPYFLRAKPFTIWHCTCSPDGVLLSFDADFGEGRRFYYCALSDVVDSQEGKVQLGNFIATVRWIPKVAETGLVLTVKIDPH